jgi:hypothetical protein
MNLYDCLTTPTGSKKWPGDSLPTDRGRLYFQDNGAKVLGVAHLDWVGKMRKPLKQNQYVFAPQLDDRLGVWFLLGQLPRLGVKCDILLTDLEEISQSTAQFFDPPKEYSWIFSFDRAGQDVVMYEYEHQTYLDLLLNYGYTTGWGSFSDICWLEHLGVAGFNFGTCYYEQHTTRCWADLKKANQAANQFHNFWENQKDCKMEHLWPDGDYDDSSGYQYYDHKLDAWAYEEGFPSRRRRSRWSRTWEPKEESILDRHFTTEQMEELKYTARYFDYESVEDFIRDGGLDFCHFTEDAYT